ncbi:phage holin family protein [Fructobacillus parabroussonetiae]|uniref:Phage holin family protein n=1 Tax=Fructobacillus parabroussonetiae TaxID=2713174 RepID=A0ABS5QWT3_9LACO|nr:phage holin family protein [Fructobacillus parabroussonetiae]MBS9337663.1 phage holin family protein [Fructobacillus parabroussonetiae]MCK8617301.1 phage holin family protein [Fructobacillus parabroussonetiae]
MRFIMQTAINMAVFLACALLFPNGFILENMTVAALAAIVLTILNRLLKPVLMTLALPLVIISLGAFSLIINAALLELTAYFVPGFAFTSFWWAFLVAVLMTVANLIFMDQTRIEMRRQ